MIAGCIEIKIFKFENMFDVKVALIILLIMHPMGPLMACSTTPEPQTEASAPRGKYYSYFVRYHKKK